MTADQPSEHECRQSDAALAAAKAHPWTVRKCGECEHSIPGHCLDGELNPDQPACEDFEEREEA